jgi:hypothetical protein
VRRQGVLNVDPLPTFKAVLLNSIETRFTTFDDPVNPCRLAALFSPVNTFYFTDDKYKADTRAALERIAEWIVYLATDRDAAVAAAPAENNAVVSSLFENESAADVAARRAHEAATAKSSAMGDLRDLVTTLLSFAKGNEEQCKFDIARPHAMDNTMREFYARLSTSGVPKDKRIMQVVSLILSGAASSASAERAFSAAGLLDSSLRARTSAETLEAMAVVKIFLRRASPEEIESFFQYAERCFHSVDACQRLKGIVGQCLSE